MPSAHHANPEILEMIDKFNSIDLKTAYNSLIYSADGKIIYNSTLFDIWFDMDYELYHIKPGETMKI